MPFIVVVQYHARPGHVDDLVALIRADFVASPTARPGRRFARLFQDVDEPAQANGLERLQHYRQMPRAPTALSCAMLAAPAHRLDAVESFIWADERRDALNAAGLVPRAVNRVADQSGRLVVLHGWRTQDDLRAYSATGEQALSDALAPLDTSAERFRGQFAAQFSWLGG